MSSAAASIRRTAMRIRTFTVDAFTPTPFGGNPAAVALLDPAAGALDDSLRQKIAAEFNLSETAFLEPLETPPSSSSSSVWSSTSRFRLRWFTPTVEVPLCGHATLAAAAALVQGCNNTSPSLHFQTLSGELVVSRSSAASAAAPAAAAAGSSTTTTAAESSSSSSSSSSSAVQLEMSLPLSDPTDPLPPAAKDVKGPLVTAAVGALPVAEVCFNAKLGYLLIVLAPGQGRAALESIQPDFPAMLTSSPSSSSSGSASAVKGIIVAAHGEGGASLAPSGAPHDFVSRFFAPWLGVNEDPVTGSAHAVLGPYFARALGRTSLTARQCSVRGGELSVTTQQDTGRVIVGGAATIVIEGMLTI